jgi:hypothetical protein
MDVLRKWFCSCTGKPVELSFEIVPDEEPAEPVCPRCGASPSSDPRRTVAYQDQPDWKE